MYRALSRFCEVLFAFAFLCVCVCIYIYIYIYIHTHKETQMRFLNQFWIRFQYIYWNKRIRFQYIYILDGWPANMSGYFYESAVFWWAFRRPKYNSTSKNTQAYWLGNRLIRCLVYDCFLLTLMKSLIFFIYSKITWFCLISENSRRCFSTLKNRFVHSGLWLAVVRANISPSLDKSVELL